MEKEKFLKEIGAQIYLARRKSRIPQKLMARDIAISASRLCRIERGKEPCSAFLLYRICCYLDMSFTIEMSKGPNLYTCTGCKDKKKCEYAFDQYNINGDCLAIK